MGQGADVKKRDRKSFKRLDRAIAGLAEVRIGSTVSFAAYEPFKVSGLTTHVCLNMMPNIGTNKTLFECKRCGAKESGEWSSPEVAEALTSVLGMAFFEKHKNCKVPT